MVQFISGELDVASAMSCNTYLLLLNEGFSEENLKVIDMDKEGAAMQEDLEEAEAYLESVEEKSQL